MTHWLCRLIALLGGNNGLRRHFEAHSQDVDCDARGPGRPRRVAHHMVAPLGRCSSDETGRVSLLGEGGSAMTSPLATG